MEQRRPGADDEGPRYCPVHGDPDRLGYEWPCPIAVEGGPEVETCPYFVAEMERRRADVAAGNFWRMDRTPDGFVFHEVRNHEPTGVIRRLHDGQGADR